MNQTKKLQNPNSKAQKPAFADPALEVLYRSWQRNRGRNPGMALLLVEAYAREKGIPTGDLLRRFAEAEAREASQALQGAQEGPGGTGGVLPPYPFSPGALEAPQSPEEAIVARAVQELTSGVQHSIGEPLGVDHQEPTLEGEAARYRRLQEESLRSRWSIECCTPAPPPRNRLQDWISWAQGLVETALAETPEEETERRKALEDLLALYQDKGLEAGPVKLHMLLLYLGRRYLRERFGPQAPRKASQVSFHLPNDLIAAYLQVDRVTVWRWMRLLKETGLADSREHRAWAVIDGTPGFYTSGNVWLVRLKPGRVRWTREDLAHPWRDLREDMEAGRTAYRVLWPEFKGKGKNRKKALRPSLELLVRWTLGIREAPPPEAMPTRRDPESLAELFALTELDPQERPDAIQALAERMAHDLGDPHSVKFYMRVLWRVVEGRISPMSVYNAYRVARAPIRERRVGDAGVRKPGALFTAHLLQVPGVREALRGQAA